MSQTWWGIGGLVTSVVFVHGIGVRQPSYDKTFERVTRGFARVRPDVRTVRCFWAEPHGARLGMDGASIPARTADRGIGAAGPDDDPPAVWAVLQADPLAELHAFAQAADSADSGFVPGRQDRWEDVADAVRALFPDAADRVTGDGPRQLVSDLGPHAREAAGKVADEISLLRVRAYGLDSASADQPLLSARPFSPTAPRRTARQLADASGRTVMLVLSDGVGPGWGSGAVQRLLRGWARHSPVAVVQPLPARMWPRRGMPTQQLLVTADREGAPGRALSVRHPLLPPGLMDAPGTPVPVLELTGDHFGCWAGLLGTGKASAPLPVMLLDDEVRPVGEPGNGPATVPAPPERLRRFQGAASPESQRLAAALAAVHPLTLPVMRLVHQSGRADRTSDFHPAQLAEVFLGGLLRRRHDPQGLSTPPSDATEYEFHPGVADLLLDGVRTPDAMDTAAQVTEFLLHRQGGGPEFRARLSDDAGDSAVAADARRFAAASPQLLQRLGLLDPASDPAVDDDPSDNRRPAEPATVLPPRSYASERVQPPLIALVRRIVDDEQVPESVHAPARSILARAEERDEESGWWGVRALASLTGELLDAGWREYADRLRDELREQLGQVAGADDLESRNLRGHMALALNRLGEHDEAEGHLRQVVEISERVHGAEDPYALNARKYLVNLLEAAGRDEAAVNEATSLIEVYERHARRDPIALLAVRHQRARLLLSLARLDEAAVELRALVSAFRDQSGPTHYDTLNSRVWLTIALRRAGRHEEATAEIRNTAEEARSSLPVDDKALLNVLTQLGRHLDDRELHEEAEQVWRELTGTVSAALGPLHWRTLAARRNLVGGLRKLRRWEEAMAEAETLIQEMADSRGSRHTDYFTARALRADILADQERYEEAEAEYRSLLADQLRHLGDDDAGTANTRYRLAVTLGEAKRYDEALTEFTRLLGDRIRRLGTDARPALLTRRWRAATLARLERFAEAEEEYRTTLAGDIRTRGAETPATLATRMGLANLLRDLSRDEEAEHEYRLVAEGRTRVLGPDDPLTANARHYLGDTLNRLGRFAEAETELRTALDVRLRVLGADAAHSLRSRLRLGDALRGLGQVDEAREQWRTVLDVGGPALGDDHELIGDAREHLSKTESENG